MAFLRLLAERLHAHHGADLARVAVVLPSQRAGLHLRRHLARVHGGPLWSPDLLTPDSFLERLSGLREQPAHLTLLELHAVHRSLKGPAADDLHTFLAWATTALHDMNEVDEHLHELELTYRDLRHFEEIDAWSYRGGTLSEGQQRLAHHWAHHAALHRGLAERLLPRGVGTRGLIARRAASMVVEEAWTPPWHAVWFAGLNVLSPAMHRVMDTLRERGRAHFAWDADAHYLHDPLQEAGRALRTAIARHGPGVVPLSDRITTDPPTVHTVAVPNTLAMVHAAVQQVMALPDDERARTCVLLADADTLLPFLSLLPEACGPVNITMGLALPQLPLHGLFGLHARLRADADPRGARLRDLAAFLEHPVWAGAPAVADLRERVARERYGRLRTEALLDGAQGPVVEALRHALAAHGDDGTRARAALVEAVTAAQGDPFIREQAQRIAQVLDQLSTALAWCGGTPGEAGALGLLERLLRQARVDLHGEPMEGLQVMGMLESRATDHHRVIVIGANEDTLPRAEPPQSFIPGELRRTLALPLRTETEAVEAHTFMRLLHHAREITLLYVSGGDGAGERSRYITQLEHELPALLHPSSLRPAMPPRPDVPLQIPLTPELHRRLQHKAERGLSPTALTDLLACPLNFVFRHGWGIPMDTAASPALADNELGTLVHAAFETLYTPFVGRAIDPAALQKALPEVLRTLDGRLPPGLNAAEGPASLQVGMAAQAIERAVLHEVAALQKGGRITLVGLETTLSGELPAAVHGQDHPVRLHGRLDRIEVRDGHVHLVDLKTGRVDHKKLTLALPGTLTADHGKALQLLLYAWLWLTDHPACPAVTAELRPLRNTVPTGMPLTLNGSTTIGRDHMPLIEAAVGDLVRGLFEPGRLFTHREKERYCTFCRAGA